MDRCYDCDQRKGYIRINTTNGEAWVCPQCAAERDVQDQIDEAARYGDDD